MKTSQKQISLFTEDELTFSREDSHVNHIQQQGSEKERTMSAIYGQRCLEQFGRFSHVGSWAKTFAGLLIGMGEWYSMRCKLTWKLKGTKSNRLYFQLVPKTLPTDEIGSGLLLLKTPCTADAYTENLTKKEQSFGNSGTLAQEVQTGFIYQKGMLPTPQAMDSMTNPPREITPSGRIIRNQGHNGSAPLKDLAMNGLLPTPTSTSDAKGGCTRPNQKRQNDTLAHSMHAATNGTPGKTSQLNPRFVAEMMGFPPNWTELPFLSGETNQ